MIFFWIIDLISKIIALIQDYLLFIIMQATNFFVYYITHIFTYICILLILYLFYKLILSFYNLNYKKIKLIIYKINYTIITFINKQNKKYYFNFYTMFIGQWIGNSIFKFAVWLALFSNFHTVLVKFIFAIYSSLTVGIFTIFKRNLIKENKFSSSPLNYVIKPMAIGFIISFILAIFFR